MAFGANLFMMSDLWSCINQSKFHFFSLKTERHYIFIDWNLNRSEMFCWSFLLDVVLCGLAIVAYVIFNKKSIKHKTKRNDDLEEPIEPDEPSASVLNQQQQKLNLDTHALLERIGDT